MKKFLYRYCSVILILCMLMTMVPVVYADDQGENQSAAQASYAMDDTDKLALSNAEASNAETTCYYSDMPAESNWAYAAMKNAVENEILRGNSDGLLVPNSPITRAEMATIINRLFGASEQADISAFSDVESDKWYYSEMAKAVQMKTFNGTSDGKMNPNGMITREEAFTVIARAIKIENDDDSCLNTFSDQNKIQQYARKYFSGMVLAGYIKGNGGFLNPNDSISRQEVAQVIYNLIQVYCSRENGTISGLQNGNVIISEPGVSVKNATINGDLIIGDGVGDGEVSIDNSSITGRLIVRGGGEHSIKIVNKSNVGSVIVSKTSSGKVRVVSSDGAKVDMISVNDGSDDVKLEGTFLSVSVDSSTPIILSGAVVTNLEVKAPEASVNVESGTVANTVVSATATSAELSTGEHAKMGNISVPSDAAVKIDGSVAQITVTAENATADTKANITLGSTAKVDTIKSQEGASASLNADASAKVNNIEAANKNDISISSDSSAMKEKLENAVKETNSTTDAKTEEKPGISGGGGGGGSSDPTPVDTSKKVSSFSELLDAIDDPSVDSIKIIRNLTISQWAGTNKPITIASGVSVTITDYLFHYGTLTNNGTIIVKKNSWLAIEGDGILINNGKIENSAYLCIYGTLKNKGTLSQKSNDNPITLYGHIDNEGTIEYGSLAHPIVAYSDAVLSGVDKNKVSFAVEESDYYYADGTIDEVVGSIQVNGQNCGRSDVYSYVYGVSANVYGSVGLNNCLTAGKNFISISLLADSNPENNSIEISQSSINAGSLYVGKNVVLTNSNAAIDVSYLSLGENAKIINEKTIEVSHIHSGSAEIENKNNASIIVDGSLMADGTTTIRNAGVLQSTRTYVNPNSCFINESTGTIKQKGDFQVGGTLQNSGTIEYASSPVIQVLPGSVLVGVNTRKIGVEYAQKDIYLTNGTVIEKTVSINGKTVNRSDGIYSYVYGASAYVYCSDDLDVSLPVGKQYESIQLLHDESSEGGKAIAPMGTNTIDSQITVGHGTELVIPTGSNITLDEHTNIYGNLTVSAGASLQINGYTSITNGILTNNGILTINSTRINVGSDAKLNNNGTLQTTNNGSIYVYSNGAATNLQNNPVIKSCGTDFYDEDGICSREYTDNTTITGTTNIQTENFFARVIGKIGFVAMLNSGKNYDSVYVEEASDSSNNDIVLSKSITLDGLDLDENISLTIPNNISLTVDTIYINGSVVVQNTGWLTADYIDVYSGTLSNYGVVTSDQVSISDLSYYSTSDGYVSEEESKLCNYGHFTVDENMWLNGENAFIQNAMGAYFAVYADIQLSDGAGLKLYCVTTSADTSGFYCTGEVYVNSTQHDSKLLKSYINIESTGELTNVHYKTNKYAYSEATLRTMLADGTTDKIFVRDGIELANDLTISANRYISFSSLSIPSGVTLTFTGSKYLRISDLVVDGGNLILNSPSYISANNVEVLAGTIVLTDGRLDCSSLTVESEGEITIEEDGELDVSQNYKCQGTLDNSGSIIVNISFEYPDKPDLSWVALLPGTVNYTVDAYANTESDFWAAQLDEDVDTVYYYGDDLVISQNESILKESHVSASILVENGAILEIDAPSYISGLVTDSGSVICSENNDQHLYQGLTVTSTGSFESKGHITIYDTVLIDGSLIASNEGICVFGDVMTVNGTFMLNTHLQIGIYGSYEAEYVYLNQGANVQLSEDAVITVVKNSIVYQYCDLIVPKGDKTTMCQISNEGQFISYGSLSVEGIVINTDRFEIQSEDASIEEDAIFNNFKDGVLQIQTQYSLTNNGTINNYGQIRIMNGASFVDNGTLENYDDGTVDDQNLTE